MKVKKSLSLSHRFRNWRQRSTRARSEALAGCDVDEYEYMLCPYKALNRLNIKYISHLLVHNGIALLRSLRLKTARKGYVRPLSLFYSDVSADEVEERSFVPRARSHARLRRNATMSHAFSHEQQVPPMHPNVCAFAGGSRVRSERAAQTPLFPGQTATLATKKGDHLFDTMATVTDRRAVTEHLESEPRTRRNERDGETGTQIGTARASGSALKRDRSIL
ncbi:hypothetical protein EVAR_14507_1 [Eumeta japonica]|uniref:Uncharacterized protein n=1 Tax=Eumeta variegata TaxID=151549 RepID=A0A4C1U3A5_EUMVA|nr:hypothetical protein EVAR_14507_1 [Eumeta japonica]